MGGINRKLWEKRHQGRQDCVQHAAKQNTQVLTQRSLELQATDNHETSGLLRDSKVVTVTQYLSNLGNSFKQICDIQKLRMLPAPNITTLVGNCSVHSRKPFKDLTLCAGPHSASPWRCIDVYGTTGRPLAWPAVTTWGRSIWHIPRWFYRVKGLWYCRLDDDSPGGRTASPTAETQPVRW